MNAIELWMFRPLTVGPNCTFVCKKKYCDQVWSLQLSLAATPLKLYYSVTHLQMFPLIYVVVQLNHFSTHQHPSQTGTLHVALQ